MSVESRRSLITNGSAGWHMFVEVAFMIIRHVMKSQRVFHCISRGIIVEVSAYTMDNGCSSETYSEVSHLNNSPELIIRQFACLHMSRQVAITLERKPL